MIKTRSRWDVFGVNKTFQKHNFTIHYTGIYQTKADFYISPDKQFWKPGKYSLSLNGYKNFFIKSKMQAKVCL